MSGAGIEIAFQRFNEDWSDKEAYVIGGGPSLIGFDFDSIPRENTVLIGANKSAFVANADVLCTVDRIYTIEAAREIEEFPGLAVVGTARPTLEDAPKNALFMRVDRRSPISMSRNHICGLNSGFACMNLAFMAGCKKIHLLGIDMKKLGNTKHFHGGYPWDKNRGEGYRSWVKYFNNSVDSLKSRNCEVIHYVGPIGSELNCFPQKPLRELTRHGL